MGLAQKLYYERNKELVKKRSSGWRKNNPDRYKENHIRYNEQNREKIKEYQKEWKEKNKEQYLRSGREYSIAYHEKKILQMAGRPKTEYCEICAKKHLRIVFDHNHANGKFRGWICHNCNLVLGLVDDDVELLYRMIQYLKGDSDNVSSEVNTTEQSI